MKDYVRGAFEALSWVREILAYEKKEDVIREIDAALEDIRRGLAIDFRYRLKAWC